MATHRRKPSVVGLGYVGLPVAVAFGMQGPTIGFDISAERVKELEAGHDRTGEVDGPALARADVRYTSNAGDLTAADFHVVAVPTPVDKGKHPDLTPVLDASRTVGEALKRGDIVVYESTVYPGATEDECVPVLEQVSGLQCGRDFHVGYSPQFFLGTTSVTGVIVDLTGVDVVQPGDRVSLAFELQSAIGVEPGMRFVVREGGHTVGAGLVTAVS